MTAGRMPAKHVPKALLGLVMEQRLTSYDEPETVSVSSAWDAWWACYRAALPVDQLGVQVTRPGIGCADCDHDVVALAASSPPRHPDAVGGRPCNCLLAWAIRMRGSATSAPWPVTWLTLALLKPGAPHARIRTQLEQTHRVLDVIDTVLTTDDTRRFYAEAYGADYVGALHNSARWSLRRGNTPVPSPWQATYWLGNELTRARWSATCDSPSRSTAVLCTLGICRTPVLPRTTIKV